RYLVRYVQARVPWLCGTFYYSPRVHDKETRMNASKYYDGFGRQLLDGMSNARMLLYLVNPYESSFEKLEDVPDYQSQVWLSFFVLILLENAILYAKKEASFRLNDHVNSLSHWILQETGRILFRGAEYYLYISIYEKFRLWELAWDSPWTWWATAIGVDFCYYWVHRANHEVLFLWAHHQVHHSSEEFNLVVGLRQSILQQWCSFVSIYPYNSHTRVCVYKCSHRVRVVQRVK
ncbi:unnamed protein product, partial [Trichogramma brassicae]